MPKEANIEAISSHVVRLIREERERQSISKKGLAERAGLSRQMISYVEAGERMPTLDTLLRISSALGLKLEDILTRARKQAGR